MKRFLLCIFASSIVAASAQTPVVPDASRSQDVIRTKAGLEIAGAVTRSGKDNLEVRFKSPTGAFVTQRVPLANVDRVTFAGSDTVDEELARSKVANLPQLLLKWRSLQGLLDVRESDVGAYGIRAAQLLLESSSSGSATTAREILDQIIQRDWDTVRRDRARTLAIDSLRRAGKHDEALKAARDFLATDAAAESKAEASYYLALTLADDYRTFVTENPRWASDPIMRPKREVLYNEVLDCLLAPYLRYGAPPEVTAKSLLAATNFLEEFGEHDEARALAQDVVKIFPAQPEAAEARKFLETN
jgi:hypothetical protein